MSSVVLADLIRPARNPRLARVVDAALVAGASLVIAGSAQVAIPLPFTPVPVTMQTLAVLLAGCLLGSRRGALAVIAYLCEGFAGLPFFSGGTAGISHLLGPTGGYLLGFLAAAYVVGLLTERGVARTWYGSAAVLGLGSLVLYVPGLMWLSAYTGPGRALALGFLPFAIGDGLKMVAGWGALRAASLIPEERGRLSARPSGVRHGRGRTGSSPTGR
jgi:biotin transport system substrate-specific component